MALGTNPFDDSHMDPPGGGEDYNLVRQTNVGSTNPFDFQDTTGGYPHSPDEDDGNYEMNDEDDDFGNDVNVISNEDDGGGVEASWQFLGDLPYRRVPLYAKVQWSKKGENFGLAAFPPNYLQGRSDFLDERDIRQLLTSTTVTKVTGCPNGGPIAAITLPTTGSHLVSLSTSRAGGATTTTTGGGKHSQEVMSSTELRIMTCSGCPLANVEFPPRSLALNQRRLYSAADVMTIGFTNRTILIVVLRDSLCLTYDLSGTMILPPFAILPHDNNSSIELIEANVFEGGVSVLNTAMNCAVVEILDEHEDPAYVDGAHIASRKIVPEKTNGDVVGGASARNSTLPPYFAIVTPLATANHAAANYYSYCALAVLPRVHTASRHPEVFLSTSDNSVVIADTALGDITDVDCRARISSPIVSMSFAPNGRFLACFTQGSILTVISTSFETKVLDFDTSEGSASPPRDMKWCGEDSVVLHWKNLGVLMVGPYGDWLRFPYENVSNLHIIPEIDCCRVVTDNSTEILQRVPPATSLLLRIGSIEPSAMLLDASDAFEAGSPASDEAARAITRTGMLLDAIETCTEAALREFDIPTQKRLLRAASYGMHFAYKDPAERRIMGGSTSASGPAEIKPSETAIKFVASARKIRVLNAIRDPSVGFALTSSQYDAISPTGVIARLIAMKRPALATSICSYLSLDKSVHAFARASRAAAFVAADRENSDSQTAESVIRILNEGLPGDQDSSIMNRGGFSTVARAANKAGRPGVANLLLQLETSVADKVPALIATGSYADAAAVATNSKDADLILLSLLEFEKACLSSTLDSSKAQASFLNSVVNTFSAESNCMLQSYFASMNDVKHVMNLLLRGSKYAQAGSIMANRAIAATKDQERQTMLQEASRLFGLGRDNTFRKMCTDEYLDLLSEQDRLRLAYGPDVAPETSSVTSTMFSIICYSAAKPRDAYKLVGEADRLAKKFRVPEKCVWHVKVRAFAASEQWRSLRSLGDSKAKPPIGFKYFALATIKGQQSVNEIMHYIDKITDSEERYDLFCEAKLWKRAVDEAKALNDSRRIVSVRSLCNDPVIQDICDRLVLKGGAN